MSQPVDLMKQKTITLEIGNTWSGRDRRLVVYSSSSDTKIIAKEEAY